MWVVKLGGSLIGTPQLKAWLRVLAEPAQPPLIIVPGGGPFADTVRAWQSIGGYDDRAAHRMALAAMEQYAFMMQSLQPTLALAETESEITGYARQSRPMLWRASRMVLADSAIPQNWQVTSDSLAAWLAVRLKAERLVIVKSAPAVTQDIAAMVEAEVLDRAFIHYAQQLAYQPQIVGREDYTEFKAVYARSASMQSASDSA